MHHERTEYDKKIVPFSLFVLLPHSERERVILLNKKYTINVT